MSKRNKKDKVTRLYSTNGIDDLNGQSVKSKNKEYYYTWDSYSSLQPQSQSLSWEEFFNEMDFVTFNPSKKNILDFPGNYGVKRNGKLLADKITGTPVVNLDFETNEGFNELFKVISDFMISARPETFQTVIGRDISSGSEFMFLAGTDESNLGWGLNIIGSPLNPFYVI